MRALSDGVPLNLASGGTRGDADLVSSFTHQTQSGFRRHAEQSNPRLFANAGLHRSGKAANRFYVTLVITGSKFLVQ